MHYGWNFVHSLCGCKYSDGKAYDVASDMYNTALCKPKGPLLVLGQGTLKHASSRLSRCYEAAPTCKPNRELQASGCAQLRSN